MIDLIFQGLNSFKNNEDIKILNKIKIIKILKQKNFCLDCSLMGSGKTFTCIEVLKELNQKFLIICPPIIIKKWLKMINKNCINNNCLEILSYNKLNSYFDLFNN